MFLFLSLAVSANMLFASRIPITFESHFFGFVDVRYDRVYPSNHRSSLRVSLGATTRGSMSGDTVTLFPDEGESTDAIVFRIDNSAPGSNLLGIGPGSDIVRDAGPVDFIRQTHFNGSISGFLQVGSIDDAVAFSEANCFANSSLVIPTRPERRGYFDYVTGFDMRLGLLDSIHSRPIFTSLGGGPALLLLPPNMLEEISGFFHADQQAHFGFNDCDETLTQLPDIVLSFNTGQVILQPEDYTRKFPGNVCQLLIEWRRGIEIAEFNPILLPNMNFRSNEDELIICEAPEIIIAS